MTHILRRFRLLGRKNGSSLSLTMLITTRPRTLVFGGILFLEVGNMLFILKGDMLRFSIDVL